VDRNEHDRPEHGRTEVADRREERDRTQVVDRSGDEDRPHPRDVPLGRHDDVHHRPIRHRRAIDDEGVAEAHRTFGGVDIPATVAGMLAGLGLTVLLAGLAGAAGSVGYQRGVDETDLSFGGLVTGFLILVLAFLVGGWVAGRMARYDGLRNGFVTALWFLVLTAGVSALGAWADDRYEFFDEVRLPQWFSDLDTGVAVATAVAGAIVVLLAGTLGGGLGARYHRRADDVIVRTHEDEIVRSGAADARIDLIREDDRRVATR